MPPLSTTLPQFQGGRPGGPSPMVGQGQENGCPQLSSPEEAPTSHPAPGRARRAFLLSGFWPFSFPVCPLPARGRRRSSELPHGAGPPLSQRPPVAPRGRRCQTAAGFGQTVGLGGDFGDRQPSEKVAEALCGCRRAPGAERVPGLGERWWFAQPRGRPRAVRGIWGEGGVSSPRR